MIELNEQEQKRGFINLLLLPEQAEIINGFLASRGFGISPPREFDGEPQRILTFSDEAIEVAREH